MAGRAHETENIFAGAGDFQGRQRGGGGSTRESGNIFKKRRVGIEVLWNFQAREHCGRVGAEDLFVGNVRRSQPFHRQFGLMAQPFGSGRDPGRPFRMSLTRVAGAFFVGDDFHCDATMIGKNSGEDKC